MKLKYRKATALLCAAALAGVTGLASARTLKHHRHHHYRHAAVANAQSYGPFGSTYRDDRYPSAASNWGSDQSWASDQSWTTNRTQSRRMTRAMTRRMARQARAEATVGATTTGSFTGSSLVDDARRYIGTNPTNRSSLWCGAFMDKVLRDTGHPGGGNLALGYLRYGHRVSGPQVGAIAVMGRRHGGHVGVVSGVDPNGNPIIVSGNHNRTVAESVYPRGRIIAYVVP